MTKKQLFKILERQIEVARFEAHVRRDLLKRLAKLQRQIKGRVGEEDLDNIGKRDLNKLIKDIEALSKYTHAELAEKVGVYSVELAENETAFFDKQFADYYDLPKSKPPIVAPLVLGLTIDEWLSKQASDYANSVKMAVRNNDTIDHLPRQLANKTKAFTATWSASVSQQRQLQLADADKSTKGYWHVSVLDSKTSDICLVRSDKRWDNNKKPIEHDLALKQPPLHPHCRSKIIKIKDVSKPPETTSVEEWLGSMSEAKQNELLGNGKAAMYRRGDITLRDLLDQSGRPKALYRLQAELENSTVSPMIKMYRSPWRDDFPDTIIDRPLGDATKHPLYKKAKAGDTKSAYLLAKDLVTDEAVGKVRKLKGGKDIVIVPVHAEEAIGKNKIPVAVSAILADRLGVPFDADIVQAIKVSRTDQDGWHRLANPPIFAGELQKGNLALLIDDTQTQGGTFAALKGHIENGGGRVIGMYALTGKQYSVQLRLSEETLNKLRDEYSGIETWWREEFGYGFESLTEWEARYLIKSGKSPDEARDTILARRLKASK